MFKMETHESSDQDGYTANDETRPEGKFLKRRRKRCRELERIRIDNDDEDDDSDEEGNRKMSKLGSPDNLLGPREPRSCVIKANQKRKPLSRLLEQLLKNLEKKDPNNYFAWPVNDNFAPNYSRIIKRPMDFCTMKQKIDGNDYRSLNCFSNDFKLICNNAMKYNKPGTVYHKAARRLLHVGVKQLQPAKLRALGSMLTYMYDIPIRELGFDMGKMDEKLLLNSCKKGSNKKTFNRSTGRALKSEYNGDPPSDSASDTKPDTLSPEDQAKLKREAARELHRKKLARKAFPRMDASGCTTLSLIVDSAENRLPITERPITLGNFIGKLAVGTGMIQTFREDRRNQVKGVKPLDYGPFSSYAPSYDSTFASLTKDESHLLYHTFYSETDNCNPELLRFDKDSPWSAVYDMEEMFPSKTEQASSSVSEEGQQETDLLKVKVDVDQLRSLSEIGVDVDFLHDLEDEIIASQQDYGLSNALKQTFAVIQRLEAEQKSRLSASLPTHLSLVNKCTATERELARATLSCLRSMASRLEPKHIAPLTSLRKAMGVTLQHLDTPVPMPVEDLLDFEENGQHCESDAEMKEIKTELIKAEDV